MSYIDGMICAVPTANKAAFLKHAEMSAKVFRDHGALAVNEGWGVEVPDGEVTSLPLAVKRKEDETVVFSWILWPSKAARDAAWPKIMEDERMAGGMSAMPFDGKRTAFGGFDLIVEG